MQEEQRSNHVDELTALGVAAADVQKLKTAGICTLKGADMATRRTLSRIKGMSDVKVEKIKDALKKKLDASFVTAKKYAEKRARVVKITTGSSELDTILGGGIQTMSITEAFGEFRTGKTQLAMTLCVACQLEEGKKAVYIDTEGTFRPERISEIAARFEMDPEIALENIIIARPFNTEQQEELLDNLQQVFADDPNAYRLLVIDSIISLFRTDYVGRGELGERQQKLNLLLAKLTRVADEHNIAVFITNQMMSDPGNTMSFVSDPKKPIGGHVLAHASTTRIYLRKGRNETRVAKIYDSPDVAESEGIYSITEGGISDANE
ncbi:hypothetical protein NUSPORA_02553 [Nucleospora cyclopteri]